MKRVRIILCSLIFVLDAEARRANTPPVAPVTYNGVTYTAPHSGRRGGIVEAYDEVTKTKLWSKRIYGVEFSSGFEEDCQWVFVKALSVTNNHLVVVNEADHTFSLDLQTRDVMALSKDMVAFETSGETYGGAAYFPDQVEITCTLLRFDRRDVEALAKKGQLDADHILQLWQADKGHLLAMPKTGMVVSGQENVVKSVTEITYPTEFAIPEGCPTNSMSKALVAPVPSGFEMREVGVIMQVVAEVRPEGNLIFAMFNVQYIEEPSWKTYTTQLPNPIGKPVEARLDQPFFPTYSFQNQIELQNGKATLIGGGIPTVDKKGFVFALLTGQIIRKAETGEADVNKRR